MPGFPINRKDRCDTVQKVVQEDGRINPFINGSARPLVVQEFMRRNPEKKEEISHQQEMEGTA